MSTFSLYEPGTENIKPEALSTEAEKIAQEIVGKYGNQSDTSSTQLRRFYYEFKALEKKLEKEPDRFQTKILPLVQMVRSKVAYAKGSKKIQDAFANFLEGKVKEIKEVTHFRAFLLQFEAVVGFFYEKEQQKKSTGRRR